MANEKAMKKLPWPTTAAGGYTDQIPSHLHTTIYRISLVVLFATELNCQHVRNSGLGSSSADY